MLKRTRSLFFAVIIMALAIAGCSSSDDDSAARSGTPGGPATPESEVAFEKLLSSQGLALVKKVEVSGDKGYLAAFSGKYSQGFNQAGEAVGPKPKHCLILTGKPYSMGYQAATLLPEEAYGMLTDFMLRVGLSQFARMGIKLPTEGAKALEIYALLYDMMADLAWMVEPQVPAYLRQEMQGFADGMQAAGYKDIDYERLLVMNQAIDGTFFFLGAVMGYVEETDANRDAIAKARETFRIILKLSGEKGEDARKFIEQRGIFLLPQFGCNEFVVSGAVTAGGDTYHGRDFMFDSADVYQDAACLMVFLPEEGYPFATVAPPSFVGQSVGINSEGLSMGQDVCMVGVMGETPGLSSMLVLRDVLQNCNDLDTAVERVRNTTRGIPWIFFIADDETDEQYGSGVELETVTNQLEIIGPDALPFWQQLLYAGYIVRLRGLDTDDLTADGFIDRGAMVRSAHWIYPGPFKDGLPQLEPQDFIAYEDRYNRTTNFPDQIETDDDVLAAANHFIIPRLRMLHFEPIIYLAYGPGGALADSVWRYENMLAYIDEKRGQIGYFGSGDYPETGSAGWIIDFLNTQRDYPWFYRDKDKDGTLEKPVNCNVEGHHVIMNNTKRQLKGLFGYMQDPWVGVDLGNFADWYNTYKP